MQNIRRLTNSNAIRSLRLAVLIIAPMAIILFTMMPREEASALLAPKVTDADPNEGVVGNTLDVTLTGTEFNGALAVSFGAGITVNSYNIDGATQITANITIATGAADGPRDVSVTGLLGTGTLSGGFTVISPTVTSTSPNYAAQGATINVTITGTNFTGASAVSFGSGITVNNYTVDSLMQITASITIAGGASTGARDVSVTANGTTATLSSGFTVSNATTVTSTSPTFAVQGATNMYIVIAGTSFTGASAVSFGSGIIVNSYTVDIATQITANITIDGTATLGTRDVSVTAGGLTGTLSSGFTVTSSSPGPSAPTVASASPTFALQGATTDVTITGSNFTGASAVSFGSGVTVNAYVINSDTQISANITVGQYVSTGERDVSVAAGFSTGKLSGGFVVTGIPVVTGASPNCGAQGAAIDITVAGSNFSGASDVSLGTGITVTGFVVDSNVQITATITIDSNAALGARGVSVTTAGVTGTRADAFTVISPPTVTAVSLSGDAEPGATIEVIITGTDFTSTTEISMGGGITVESFTVDSPTQITARITLASDAAEGPRDVSVTARGHTATLPCAFSVVSADDSPPLPSSQSGLFLVVLGPLLLVLIVGTLAYLIYRRRRMPAEAVWEPVPIGGGTLSVSLLTGGPALPNAADQEPPTSGPGFVSEEPNEESLAPATASGEVPTTSLPSAAGQKATTPGPDSVTEVPKQETANPADGAESLASKGLRRLLLGKNQF